MDFMLLINGRHYSKTSPQCSDLWEDNSGKTYHALNMIERFYLDKLDHIFIICPTFHDNKTYNRPRLKNYTIVSDGELVKNLDSLIKMHSKGGKLSGKKSLIIIDDCSDDEDLNKRRSALSKIACSGRHANLMTWFITLRYVDVPKVFRDNSHWVLITKHTCKKSFQMLMDEKDECIPIKEQKSIKRGWAKKFMLLMNVDICKYMILSK